MNQNVYSVGDITSYIKNLFSQDFMMKKISVGGEVSNVKYHTSGHIYFTLKDSTAQIAAVMFKGNRGGLLFPMKNGDRAIVTGSIEVYERDGRYQLYAREIAPDGQGDLFQRYEQLKAELSEMGMFAPEYKKPIPKYARRIGIVTAKTGAAIQDIRNIASRRNPYVQLILCPAIVQGEGAAASIVSGIKRLDAMGLDVLIVGRGGGSFEDLFAFNEEPVVRAVFECETPVISAVGHETDTMLTDYAADQRAPTPSAAAELAVFDVNSELMHLEERREELDRAWNRRFSTEKKRLKALSEQLQALSPEAKLRYKKERLKNQAEKLSRAFMEILTERKHRLAILAESLESRSPLLRLSGGYAYLAGDDGKAKKSIKDVSLGETLTIRMKDGRILAGVNEVEYGNIKES